MGVSDYDSNHGSTSGDKIEQQGIGKSFLMHLRIYYQGMGSWEFFFNYIYFFEALANRKK